MNLEFTNGGSFATTSGTFAITGAANTHATTTVINYAIDGFGYIKTAITGGTTPTTDALKGTLITLTANQARTVIWALDAAGTVTATAGPVVPWNGGTTAPDYGFGPSAIPQLPSWAAGSAPFAITLLKAGSTLVGTWTFGTSNWNAAGFTSVIKNLVGIPSRPLLG